MAFVNETKSSSSFTNGTKNNSSFTSETKHQLVSLFDEASFDEADFDGQVWTNETKNS
jgi:hypothetical protein